ncbi:serine/threonine-protein kinase [Streptomyces sp. NPDC059894]|uniref:serine/threonine-protein kinase n=1 Tax=unclassified Streptomyces TaxID=2593676 RepID=UPI00365753CC
MGEVFAGRYELADPIGRGGVGAVWRAWDHRRRRYVAAKVLQQRDAHALLRFVREQALRIDHPHVLAPASWAADDDKVLFTMDLVGGGSLVHLVGDYGPLPPVFVCTLLDQLLSGLAAVHAEGVVHRDVKPANVLLEATGTARPRLRLSDFGIAMRLGEPRLTETNLVVGTPGYLAPEQMLGFDPDFPADLFAVGLVALYLLEGAKPDAKALVQYFTEHGTPGAPQNIPEPLWQVVATLLQPDPQARFRTATGVRKALAAAAELLPEPGPDDEQIEIFDQLGPLPPGFGPEGPLKRASGITVAPSAFEGVEGASPQHGPGTGSVAYGRGTGSSTSSAASDPRQPGGPPASAPTPGTPVPSMSDTGSFHLPPPQPTRTPTPTPTPASTSEPPPALPPRQHHATGSPDVSADVSAYHSAYDSTYDSTYALHSGGRRTGASTTAAYTAQDPQPQSQARPSGQPEPAPRTFSPHPHPHPPSPPASAEGPASAEVPASSSGRAGANHRGHRRARAPRRPGPPAKVALPLLLLALACYAVGFWALARI